MVTENIVKQEKIPSILHFIIQCTSVIVGLCFSYNHVFFNSVKYYLYLVLYLFWTLKKNKYKLNRGSLNYIVYQNYNKHLYEPKLLSYNKCLGSYSSNAAPVWLMTPSGVSYMSPARGNSGICIGIDFYW